MKDLRLQCQDLITKSETHNRKILRDFKVLDEIFQTYEAGNVDDNRAIVVIQLDYDFVVRIFPDGKHESVYILDYLHEICKIDYLDIKSYLLKEAMKIIRRIFPYFDYDSNKKNNREFYKQLGLIPKEEYNENIKNIKLLFQGKKKSIIINLKTQMSSFSKVREFEKAGEIKKRIFALEHINDIALIKDNEIASQKYENSHRFTLKGSGWDKNFHISIPLFRIEAYDIAHMGGQNMVGVMTVIENGEVNKSEYRKFIIRTQDAANDTGALEEVLSRRLRHIEWGLPNLIVVDGSTAQINVAKRVLDRYQFDIPIVGVVKDERHRPKAIIGDEAIIKINKKNILLANNESHRFAITFHKQKRNKSFLN